MFGHPEAARLTYYGLYALQHRGQESAGIVAGDGCSLHLHKGMGLVSGVFNEGVVAELPGDRAIGHVRYSTTGTTLLANAQPILVRCRGSSVALCHNGNLVNAFQLRQLLEREGSIFQTTLDTEVIAHLYARSTADREEDAVNEALNQVTGGYALLFLFRDRLIGVRDPNGIRPLSIGRLNGCYVLASESCAFDAVGAEMVRDVEPGEMVVVDEGGLRSCQALPQGRPALCIFEYIYFARPDSDLAGLNIHSVRKDLGRILARNYPADADLVTGVPDSSISAATGYAEEAGISYEMGLVKNRYIGRTFIQPAQKTRDLGVKLKLNPLKKVVSGKRVVLVDDSIVRGTTSGRIVRLLRDAGAREVHLRISSPPYRFPCYFGIDTSSKSELVAATKSVKEIERMVGADSLRYLTLEELLEGVCGRAVRTSRRGATCDDAAPHCAACFTGRYPVDVECASGKFALEEPVPRAVGGGGAR
ncbi:MAG: amidophosphoribosyltransferase [Firmicutes bacterium]|nr:amidophosphoribosyltransferase [Bacillota bacterium]